MIRVQDDGRQFLPIKLALTPSSENNPLAFVCTRHSSERLSLPLPASCLPTACCQCPTSSHNALLGTLQQGLVVLPQKYMEPLYLGDNRFTIATYAYQCLLMRDADNTAVAENWDIVKQLASTGGIPLFFFCGHNGDNDHMGFHFLPLQLTCAVCSDAGEQYIRKRSC